MKKLFESPAFALLLAVIVVIGSTLLNTKIKFGRKCAALCGEFYEQSDSVSAELRNFCSAAEKVALAAQQAELPLGFAAPGLTAPGRGQQADVVDQKLLHHSSLFTFHFFMLSTAASTMASSAR